MGYSDVSPGDRMRHLEGLKNPYGLNFGMHIIVYVHKVYMCMYMLGLGDGMRPYTDCFNMFFLTKGKSKRCKRKSLIISNLKYKGTKPLFIFLI